MPSDGGKVMFHKADNVNARTEIEESGLMQESLLEKASWFILSTSDSSSGGLSPPRLAPPNGGTE